MNVKKLKILIEKKESFLNEEERCLSWCIQNPDECDAGEIHDREIYIDKLYAKIDKLKVKLEKKENE